jgi:uncharacterized protein
MPVVVSDASPLICLSALRQFDLLHQLCGDVVVPTAVWQEITRIPSFAAAASLQPAADARVAGWLRVTAATNRPLVTQLETALDAGEAEAIALAIELGASLLLIGFAGGPPVTQPARRVGVPWGNVKVVA